MIPIRYDLARWVIAALTLLLIILFILVRPTGGASLLLFLLLLASAGAIVYPPGIYFWLLKPVCPECKGQVVWHIEQGRQNPYTESLVMTCPECAKEKVEFSFDPT